MSACPDSPAQLGIQRFNHVRGVYNPADFIGERVERNNLSPGPPPGLSDGGIFIVPWSFSKIIERGKSGFGILSARVWPPPFMQEESSIEPIDMVWC